MSISGKIMVGFGAFALAVVCLLVIGNHGNGELCDSAGGVWVKARHSESVKRYGSYICISKSAVIELHRD